jgi:hypothetical protein
VRLMFAPALCALLATAQPAAAPAQPAAAAAQPGEANLRPAFIAEPGIGDVVFYVSDTFRKSAPTAPEPLNVITIRRSNPGDAFNSPADDLNGLNLYLKDKNGFAARDLVGFASSRDLVRLFFRGDYPALARSFTYPRATWGKADPAMWTRLRAIAIPDFALYLAKRASLQASAERQIFGSKVPLAQDRTLEFKLVLEAPNAAQGAKLAAALKRDRFGGIEHKVIARPGEAKLGYEAKFRFSEASMQQLMNDVCAAAAREGAECVSWNAHFTPLTLKL